MTREFEIIKLVRHHNRGLFIITRHIGSEHGFTVGEGSLFGGIPVCQYLEIRPSSDIFTFRPLRLEDYFVDIFEEGQRIQMVLGANSA